MMTENADKKREQIHLLCMDEMVPKDHLLRIIDKAIDWTFIYDLVKDKYSHDTGRPSMDPVTLIKIPLIQYLYGIKSMRQTVKEIEVNVAYRWFLGLDMTDKVPHFSTFGKNYTRRFKDTDLFEQIFAHILEECYNKEIIFSVTPLKYIATTAAITLSGIEQATIKVGRQSRRKNSRIKIASKPPSKRFCTTASTTRSMYTP